MRDSTPKDSADAVYPADPLRLLETIPELELFLTDRRVRGAIERGRPHDVYRALFWARWLRRFPQHQDTLDALLGDRRLFVGPMRGAPAMFTYNGVGLALYGESERKGDGGYVATHYVVLFFVPLFPLGAYLTVPAGPRSYRFFGKAPFGPATWLWNRLVVLGVLGGVVFGVGSAAVTSRYHDVHVLNGLPFPIAADVCGRTVTVAPEGRETVTGSVGTCLLDARTLDGAPIETQTLALSAGSDLVVWNVAGAAPLYRETVFYGPPGRSPTPDGEIFCGRSIVEIDDVDFAFREPPSRMSTRRNETIERTHVDVARADEADCLFEALGRLPGDASRIARLTALGLGYEPTATMGIARLLSAYGLRSEALELIVAARDRHDELEIHVAYQDELRAMGRAEEARAEYAARAIERSDGDAQYLAVRLDVRAGALDRWLSLVERFPEHPAIGLGAAWELCNEGRFDEGVARYEAVEAFAPLDASAYAVPHAVCLFAAHRQDEARLLLESAFGTATTGLERAIFGSVHAEMSRVMEPPQPSTLFESRAPVDDRATLATFHRAASGYPISPTEVEAIEDPMVREVVETLRLAHTDPGAAAQTLATLSPIGHSLVARHLETLLLAEIARVGDAGLFQSLSQSTWMGPEWANDVATFVLDGTETDRLRSLPRTDRAAVHFIRSRVTTLDAETRAAELALAHELDEVPAWVRHAEEGWPLP